MTIKDVSSGEHYRWGKASEGWHLLKREDFSGIEERVPPGDREQRHYHNRARQFFYVLRGTAVVELEGERHQLRERQGLEVPPGAAHQFCNESDAEVIVLVVSVPMSHGDRVNA